MSNDLNEPDGAELPARHREFRVLQLWMEKRFDQMKYQKKAEETRKPRQNKSDPFNFISIAIFPTTHQPRKYFLFQVDAQAFQTFSLFGELHVCVFYSSNKSTGEEPAHCGQVHCFPCHTSRKKPFPHLGSLSCSTCTHQYLPFELAAPTAGGRTKGMLIAMLFCITAWGSLEAEWIVQGVLFGHVN